MPRQGASSRTPSTGRQGGAAAEAATTNSRPLPARARFSREPGEPLRLELPRKQTDPRFDRSRCSSLRARRRRRRPLRRRGRRRSGPPAPAPGPARRRLPRQTPAARRAAADRGPARRRTEPAGRSRPIPRGGAAVPRGCSGPAGVPATAGCCSIPAVAAVSSAPKRSSQRRTSQSGWEWRLGEVPAGIEAQRRAGRPGRPSGAESR